MYQGILDAAVALGLTMHPKAIRAITMLNLPEQDVSVATIANAIATGQPTIAAVVCKLSILTIAFCILFYVFISKHRIYMYF